MSNFGRKSCPYCDTNMQNGEPCDKCQEILKRRKQAADRAMDAVIIRNLRIQGNANYHTFKDWDKKFLEECHKNNCLL